jgi:hypothetical protein
MILPNIYIFIFKVFYLLCKKIYEMGLTILNELKNACNLIVGEWQADDNSHKMIFNFSEKLLKVSKCTVINSDGSQSISEYTLAVHPTTGINNEYLFYVELGTFDKTSFLIKKLNKENLTVIHLHKYQPIGNDIIYYRKIDTTFADDILQGLH